MCIYSVVCRAPWPSLAHHTLSGGGSMPRPMSMSVLGQMLAARAGSPVRHRDVRTNLASTLRPLLRATTRSFFFLSIYSPTAHYIQHPPRELLFASGNLLIHRRVAVI